MGSCTKSLAGALRSAQLSPCPLPFCLRRRIGDQTRAASSGTHEQSPWWMVYLKQANNFDKRKQGKKKGGRGKLDKEDFPSLAQLLNTRTHTHTHTQIHPTNTQCTETEACWLLCLFGLCCWTGRLLLGSHNSRFPLLLPSLACCQVCAHFGG